MQLQIILYKTQTTVWDMFLKKKKNNKNNFCDSKNVIDSKNIMCIKKYSLSKIETSHTYTSCLCVLLRYLNLSFIVSTSVLIKIIKNIINR